MATLNTVLGPIDASQIGHTMSHVHLTIDLTCWHLPPESGPERGLSEGRITLRNLGAVRLLEFDSCRRGAVVQQFFGAHHPDN